MSPAVITTDDEKTEPRFTGRDIRRMMVIRLRWEIGAYALICVLLSGALIGNIMLMNRLFYVTSVCCPAAMRYYDSHRPTLNTAPDPQPTLSNANKRATE